MFNPFPHRLEEDRDVDERKRQEGRRSHLSNSPSFHDPYRQLIEDDLTSMSDFVHSSGAGGPKSAYQPPSSYTSMLAMRSQELFANPPSSGPGLYDGLPPPHPSNPWDSSRNHPSRRRGSHRPSGRSRTPPDLGPFAASDLAVPPPPPPPRHHPEAPGIDTTTHSLNHGMGLSGSASAGRIPSPPLPCRYPPMSELPDSGGICNSLHHGTSMNGISNNRARVGGRSDSRLISRLDRMRSDHSIFSVGARDEDQQCRDHTANRVNSSSSSSTRRTSSTSGSSHGCSHCACCLNSPPPARPASAIVNAASSSSSVNATSSTSLNHASTGPPSFLLPPPPPVASVHETEPRRSNITNMTNMTNMTHPQEARRSSSSNSGLNGHSSSRVSYGSGPLSDLGPLQRVSDSNISSLSLAPVNWAPLQGSSQQASLDVSQSVSDLLAPPPRAQSTRTSGDGNWQECFARTALDGPLRRSRSGNGRSSSGGGAEGERGSALGADLAAPIRSEISRSEISHRRSDGVHRHSDPSTSGMGGDVRNDYPPWLQGAHARLDRGQPGNQQSQTHVDRGQSTHAGGQTVDGQTRFDRSQPGGEQSQTRVDHGQTSMSMLDPTRCQDGPSQMVTGSRPGSASSQLPLSREEVNNNTHNSSQRPVSQANAFASGFEDPMDGWLASSVFALESDPGSLYDLNSLFDLEMRHIIAEAGEAPRVAATPVPTRNLDPNPNHNLSNNSVFRFNPNPNANPSNNSMRSSPNPNPNSSNNALRSNPSPNPSNNSMRFNPNPNATPSNNSLRSSPSPNPNPSSNSLRSNSNPNPSNTSLRSNPNPNPNLSNNPSRSSTFGAASRISPTPLTPTNLPPGLNDRLHRLPSRIGLLAHQGFLEGLLSDLSGTPTARGGNGREDSESDTIIPPAIAPTSPTFSDLFGAGNPGAHWLEPDPVMAENEPTSSSMFSPPSPRSHQQASHQPRNPFRQIFQAANYRHTPPAGAEPLITVLEPGTNGLNTGNSFRRPAPPAGAEPLITVLDPSTNGLNTNNSFRRPAPPAGAEPLITVLEPSTNRLNAGNPFRSPSAILPSRSHTTPLAGLSGARPEGATPTVRYARFGSGLHTGTTSPGSTSPSSAELMDISPPPIRQTEGEGVHNTNGTSAQGVRSSRNSRHQPRMPAFGGIPSPFPDLERAILSAISDELTSEAFNLLPFGLRLEDSSMERAGELGAAGAESNPSNLRSLDPLGMRVGRSSASPLGILEMPGRVDGMNRARQHRAIWEALMHPSDFLNMRRTDLLDDELTYEQLVELEDVKVTTPASVFERLPTSTVVEGSTEEGLCSVCQSDYCAGDVLSHLPCKHAFHRDCIRPWLQDYSKKCPICKAAVC